jgi:cell division GTPase FtsZ
MRIVAIGLGGAGCRIVDSLYSTDRKSSKVACIQGLAVDVDESTLQQLTALPESSRLYFPAMDPEVSGHDRGTEPTVTIDISDIISRIHNLESGETDAIFICLGLGGGMTDIAPHVITGLRSSIVEPIFGLVTLPCLAEGEKRSAKAADDIDILSPLLDGMILFDNETWYKKTRALKKTLAKKEKSFAHRLGLAKDEPELSPELATYQLLNEGIVRRISLILRAGEFKADGGIELAEVVLDSGEVLNTMKGMGFITIGYAVDHLPSNPLAFLSQFRPQGVFEEENKKKASRIVDLAKQAIYHEISTPCDMTSAHKALILIAGPSHELSMKGFMTVRKWIDRSIAGLETRSGDYPVVNTKNVAIIIMLSGLENIPRIGELREIRAQHSSWSKRRAGLSDGIPAESDGDTSLPADHGTIRDEMIILPAGMKKGEQMPFRTVDPVQSRPKESPVAEPVRAGEQIHRKYPSITEVPAAPLPNESMQPGEAIQPKTSRHRVIVTRDNGADSRKPAQSSKPHSPPAAVKTVTTTPVRKTGTIQETIPSLTSLSSAGSKDAARQRIERELQKQRLKAMAGRGKPADDEITEELPAHHEPVRKRHEVHTRPATQITNPPPVTTDELREPEQKTVIITKRKLVSRPAEPQVPDTGNGDLALQEEIYAPPSSLEEYPPEKNDHDMTLVIKDTAVRAKDRVFEGRDVQKPKTAMAKDAPLIHTSLKPKKPSDHGKKDHETPDDDENPSPDHAVKKTDKKGKKPDDISWI